MLRRFHGVLCAFFDDGTLIAARQNPIIFYDSQLKKINKISIDLQEVCFGYRYL